MTLCCRCVLLVLKDLLHPFAHCSLPLNPLVLQFRSSQYRQNIENRRQVHGKKLFFSAAGTVDLREVVIV